jgi:hypothetical protein
MGWSHRQKIDSLMSQANAVDGKMKSTHSDEFVIGGYSQTGKDQYFLSLIGYYNDKGELILPGMSARALMKN